MDSEMHRIDDISDEITSGFPDRSTDEPVEAKVRSNVQLTLKSFFYTWTVGKFSKCSAFCNPNFYSPEFKFENAVWRLRLHVTESGGVKKISIRLVKKEKENIDLYIKNKVSLIDENGRVLAVNETESGFQDDTVASGQVSLNLGDSESLVLSNDKLVVHCEFLVLESKVSDSTSKSQNKICSERDLKFASAIVPAPAPKKVAKSSMPSFPEYIGRCLRERGLSPDKELVMFILMFFVLFQYAFVCEVRKMYEDVHDESVDAECVLKRKEINELIIDSTLKLKNVAEALNLTDVKLKANEVLSSYLGMYNNTNSVLPKILGGQVNASEFLTFGKDNVTDSTTIFSEGKN